MTWTFSHCPNDPVQDDGESGCRGCPAICDQDGKPRADQCAAVFVRSDPIVRPPYGDGSPQGKRNRTKVIILAEAQNWRCAYCPTLMSMPLRKSAQPSHAATIEHVTASAAGGAKTWDNEVAACHACNSYRRHYSAALFWLLMQSMGFNRLKVARMIASMTANQREKTRKRLGPVYGFPVTPHPDSARPPTNPAP